MLRWHTRPTHKSNSLAGHLQGEYDGDDQVGQVDGLFPLRAHPMMRLATACTQASATVSQSEVRTCKKSTQACLHAFCWCRPDEMAGRPPVGCTPTPAKHTPDHEQQRPLTAQAQGGPVSSEKHPCGLCSVLSHGVAHRTPCAPDCRITVVSNAELLTTCSGEPCGVLSSPEHSHQ